MKISKNLKHIFIVASITFFMILAVMRLFGPTFSTPITQFFVYRENVPFLNWLYKYKFEPSPEIVLVTIDDTTLNVLQAKSDLKMFTIGKDRYAEVVEKLQSAGVKGIGIDIVFQNKDPTESLFVNTLQKYPNIVIATTLGNGKCQSDEGGDKVTCDGLPRSVYAETTWGHIESSVLGDMRTPIFSRPSTYPSWYATGELDTLSLALYKKGNLENLNFIPNTSILMPYFGIPGSYHRISFADVLSQSRVDLMTTFGGKYVFIGEAGSFIHDAEVSPVTDTMMDGVESHAHFLDGLLQKRFPQSWDIGDSSVFLMVVGCILIFSASYIYASKYIGGVIAFIGIIVCIFLARYSYFKYEIVLEILPFLLAISLFSFPVTYIYRFFIVDREKRLLTSAFAHYVDPEVVHEISERAEDISLGGESRELSVLFSDIAGFTTISERLKPTDLFYLMSSYLSRMTDILTREGGTLDKYIGDAVMGFFGAPLTQYDHAIRACATALEMRDALPAFNAELESRGIEPIDFRVGIASGDVLVGNIGSHDRFNYTVLGDTVNLASRLEATSKEYGTHIIVSEGTYLLARDHYSFRKLDLITVKGKNEPVGIYELIAKKSDNTINKALYERYEKALDLYMQADYLGAGKFWETQIDIDPPSRAMAHRCLDILKGDITIVDGVYHMTKK